MGPCASLLADEGPASDPGVVARHERLNGQHAAPARNLSRLLGANGPQSARRERVDHGQVGDALARLCIAGQEVRSGHHQRPQCQIPALATLARHREPVPVPFTNFSENEHLPDGTRPPVWFALDETRSLAFFAGIWTRWTWVRKVKEGETTKRPLRVSDDRCKPGGRRDPS